MPRTARRPSAASSTLKLGQLIYLGEVEFNDWNPNKMDGFMYAKAVESIEKFGMVDPCLVRDRPQNIAKGLPAHQVIDGEHRAQACMDLGIPIPCHSLGEIDDATARKLTISLNEIHGTADPAEMGKLLNDLMADTSIEDLLVGLPMTEETVKAFTGAAGIEWPGTAPEAAPSNPGVDEPQERWVERTYRVPVSVAEVLDQAIAKARKAIEDEGAIATDPRALEVIAAEYMAG